MPMSLVVWKADFRMCSERSTGCIWRRDIQFASEWRIRLPICIGSASQPLSAFADTEYGYTGPKPRAVIRSPGLAQGISQRGTRAVPRKGCPGRPNGHLRNSSHDPHHDLPPSVRDAWRGLYTHHLARKSSSDDEGGEDHSHYLCFLGGLYPVRSDVLTG